jgi:hypothetical protein
VLAFSPLDAQATTGLATRLQQDGQTEAAKALCRSWIARAGQSPICNAIVKK